MAVKTSLPLAAAEKIVDAALAAGTSHEMMPLTVVVLDSGGHTVAMKRQDGCGIMRADVATGKASSPRLRFVRMRCARTV